MTTNRSWKISNKYSLFGLFEEDERNEPGPGVERSGIGGGAPLIDDPRE